MQPTAISQPFAKVVGLSGTLVTLLSIRASMRVVTYVVFKVAAPPPGEISEESFNNLRLLDGGLLGLENLLTLVTMILFLVWIYRVLAACRATGRAAMSPGLGVGGWFIPLANVVLPWLSVRSALRAVGAGTAIAGVWWLVWLVNTSLTGMHQLARQLMLVPELARALPLEMLDSIYGALDSTFWPYFIADTAAWGLLAFIVITVRKSVSTAS
ncbi:MAG: DUF4328 domain-containing protein [Myxococcales bacterium]|nr:DUF4328 domain-containing protein [Myxococcales bacterium]